MFLSTIAWAVDLAHPKMLAWRPYALYCARRRRANAYDVLFVYQCEISDCWDNYCFLKAYMTACDLDLL